MRHSINEKPTTAQNSSRITPASPANPALAEHLKFGTRPSTLAVDRVADAGGNLRARHLVAAVARWRGCFHCERNVLYH